MNDANSIVRRMKQVLGVDQNYELASALNKSSATISTWKKRNSVPDAVCFDFSERYQVNLRWLKYGDGSMRDAVSDVPADYVASASGQIETLVRLFGYLTPDRRNVVLAYVKDQVVLQQALKSLNKD